MVDIRLKLNFSYVGVNASQPLQLIPIHLLFRDNIEDPLSHRRTPLVDSADFESLILVANRSPRFLMLPP